MQGVALNSRQDQAVMDPASPFHAKLRTCRKASMVKDSVFKHRDGENVQRRAGRS